MSCCGPKSSGNAPKIDASTTSNGSAGSLGGDILRYIRHLLQDRRVMFGIAAIVLVAGAVFNWGWLVAIGVAPLLLAFAPCAAMCALGLCAMGGGKKDAAPQGNAGDGPVPRLDTSSSGPDTRSS